MLQARSLKVILVTTACALALGGDIATAPADDADTILIDVNNPKRTLYPIAVPVGVNSDATAARQIAKITSFDLSVSGWFRVLDQRSFLADLNKEKLEIDPKSWRDVGAFGVIKHRVKSKGGKIEVTFRLYEVQKGNSSVLTRTYTGTSRELRKLVHKYCNEVVLYFTGEKGFFGSKIAFVSKGKRGKKVLAMDFDGQSVYGLTRNRSINILPAWSPGGGKIAFTSYMRRNPDLYVVGAGGGRPKRIAKYYGMNTGASWSPDGSKIALTLSRDGNPEIYVISSSSGAIIKRLTHNRAIDTSPTWSPDGREIAFVSDREGGPQIFVMSSSGGSQRRVSFNGNYNTTPDWSPRKGDRKIVYTTRAGGHYDIVMIDLSANNAMTRITQGQGNNEEPSFAPNGRAVAFSSTGRSTGSGIYLANADGTGKQHKVHSGSATAVDWGPAP